MATTRPTLQISTTQAETADTTDPTLIDLLNGLHHTCADGAYGFASCADYTNTSRHRTLFRKRAQQYDAAQTQLHAMVLRLGGVPATDELTKKISHRGWVAAHGTLCGLRDQSIVAECERGESGAYACYQQALQQDTPAGVRALIERQMQDIDASLQQIRMLREPERVAA